MGVTLSRRCGSLLDSLCDVDWIRVLTVEMKKKRGTQGCCASSECLQIDWM